MACELLNFGIEALGTSRVHGVVDAIGFSHIQPRWVGAELGLPTRVKREVPPPSQASCAAG
jgi:hypothetical protein